MRIDVPDGDVVDRITILELKEAHLAEPKRSHVVRELASLRETWAAEASVPLEEVPGLEDLRDVNARLWVVEDALRALEAQQDFGERFIQLARSVYVLNDQRARLKHAIDAHTGSELREQKSYVT